MSRFTQHVPDILDCLAQLSNDEVPTSPKLVRAMLDLLPEQIIGPGDLRLDLVSHRQGGFQRHRRHQFQ